MTQISDILVFRPFGFPSATCGRGLAGERTRAAGSARSNTDRLGWLAIFVGMEFAG
jgi:hypothetical protein